MTFSLRASCSRKIWKAIFLLAIPLLTLSACSRMERVKFTATVTANGHDYEGSVVQGFACRHGGLMFGDVGGCNVRGDAAVISLGPGGYAFLTLEYPRGPAAVLPDDVAYGDVDSSSPRTWDVSLDQAPMLVRFRDMNDSKSAEQIDPAHPENTPGMSLKSLTGEVTDEPITYDVAPKYLPWFERAKSEKWGDLRGDKGAVFPPFDTSTHLSIYSFEFN